MLGAIAMAAIDVTTENWEQQVILSEQPVLVDFWATWCPWCKKLMPIFDELAQEYRGRVKFVKVDVEPQKEIAQTYGIMSLPTLKFFCQGRSVGEIIGYMTKPNLKAETDKILRTHKECLQQSSAAKL